MIVCIVRNGITARSVASGVSSAWISARISRPASRSASDHSTSDMIPCAPTSSSGIHGTSPARRRKLVQSSSSGAPVAIARRPRSMTSGARSSGWNIARITSSLNSCSANSNSVTTPKLPPPPRSAQNRSGRSLSEVRRMRPSAVTTSADDEAVDRQPEAPHQPPDAAAEREPAGAGVRHDARREHQPMLLRGAVDVAEQGATADRRAAGAWVDGDVVQGPQVDHDSVIAGAVTGHRVPSAAHGDRQITCARVRDRSGDVVRSAWPGDQRRAAVMHRIPDGARLVVVGRSREHDRASEALNGAHRVSLLLHTR